MRTFLILGLIAIKELLPDWSESREVPYRSGEICPFEAIKMDNVFELSRRERFDALLLRKGDLAKSKISLPEHKGFPDGLGRGISKLESILAIKERA